MSEQQLDTSNVAFMQAVSFVNQTNQNIYLTGKAGTGKTTLLVSNCCSLMKYS